ncbi:MAG: ABC transporter ATP-binding protein [Halolamina sp.]
MTEGNADKRGRAREDGGVVTDATADDSVTERSSADATEVDSALLGDGLSLSYRTSDAPVVECERIVVPEGEITALVGPNGSGKSTLLKALSNHLQPDRGVIALNGRDITEYGPKELARELGHLSQQNESPEGMTVEELLYHGRYPHRGFFESVTEEDREAVDRAVALAGIEQLRETELGQLSGGQKQLAWIGMVLAQETDVLLLDEPTTFLDLHHQLRVMQTIERLNEAKGVTVVAVLHDIAQAARFADYLIALQDGELYDWGPPRSVVTEELFADVFEVDAAVIEESSELQIVPKRPLDAE